MVQKANGIFNVNWRFRRRLFNRSTGTTDEKKACLVKRRVEDTLFKLDNGLMSIPDGADMSKFVLNGVMVHREMEEPGSRDEVE